MLGGLERVHNELKSVSVPLHILHPPQDVFDQSKQPFPNVLAEFLEDYHPSVVVCDTCVLRHARRWNESPVLLQALDAKHIPLYQVDAHNVVPVWYASPKREVGARTLRPKLHKLVDECLQNRDYKKGSIPEFVGNTKPEVNHALTNDEIDKDFDYELHRKFLNWDDSVKEAVISNEPGTAGGMEKFEEFCRTGLRQFSILRNNPNREDVCSGLSPWINHGHLSFATLLRHLKSQNCDAEGKASFVEEGFVRRELSDNFLWYAPDTYDKLEAGAQWAQDSLELHSSDPREYLYSLDEFESGKTHDDLWNAAQIQLVSPSPSRRFALISNLSLTIIP